MAELILALDVPRADDAWRLLDRLPALRWVKVGPVLMTREGPAFLERLAARGLRVFLDLKWHDIPNTVAGAVRAAREQGVALATVHTLGGPRMLEAAREAAGGAVALVGVTVLTSHDADTWASAVGRAAPLEGEVVRLAGLAAAAGLDGVVCSPQELMAVAGVLAAGAWRVVPGIRPAGAAADDQVRIATAADAVRAGATHLVVGRPILQAADPAATLTALLAEAA